MNNLERLDLINTIAIELQRRMTFRDIEAYLPGFGVDLTKPYSGANSKWVYTKEMLADAPPETVLAIADELQIPHRFASTVNKTIIESTVWRPNSFRLFLSHISKYKDKASALQSALLPYGISAFVAHVDIEPTKQWLDEIEAALFSMDALAALLFEGFEHSKWTDQEVGVAIGRGVLILPVMRDLTPYGFMGKYQGLNATGKTVQQVAKLTYQILLGSPQTRARMLTALVDWAALATSTAEAVRPLVLLQGVRDLPGAYLERLKTGAETSAFYQSSTGSRNRLNAFLRERGVAPIGSGQLDIAALDGEEIPF